VQVRRKAPPLTAAQVPAAQAVDLADGQTVRLAAGDWLITRGTQVVDWASAKTFAERYELITPTTLAIAAPLCQRIERTTGIATTQTPEQLVAAIERLASIKVGEVQIAFTPGQLTELAYRATKRGHSIEAEIQAVVDRVRDEIFWKG
jgi:hypothetical protein